MNTEKMREEFEEEFNRMNPNRNRASVVYDTKYNKYTWSEEYSACAEDNISMGAYRMQVAWELWQKAWQAARAGGDGEPFAILQREIGETGWFDHPPIRINSEEAKAVQESPLLDYCYVYTAPPAPAAKVPESETHEPHCNLNFPATLNTELDHCSCETPEEDHY